MLVEREGDRAPKSRLNGGASKGLLSLRLEHNSGSAGNRLDITGARRRSRSEVAPQWRRLKGGYLLSLQLERKSGSAANRLDIIGARGRSRSEVAPQWRCLKGGYLLSLRLEHKSGSAGNRLGIIGV